MEIGGNKSAKEYFEKNDLFLNSTFNYYSGLAIKYRQELAKKAF